MANSNYSNDTQAANSGGSSSSGNAGSAAASGLGAVMGFKASQAAAKQTKLMADYDAKVKENEKILLARSARDEEKRLRKGSEKLKSAQVVAASKSGTVVGTGSNLLALRDVAMGTELDAITIRYASSIEQQKKTQQAAMIKAKGASRASAIKTQAYANLLESGAKAATMMG
mgnify:FL=1|tara:strand:+ start:68 stop:583 length:516 start_codon:yes stop_codon:yes gene_type:complete